MSVQENHLKAIADAIRAMEGSTAPIPASEFAARIQERCNTYEDPELAPSVAVGVVYKTNIEETLEERLSDAEYEMFNNKFEVKNAPGYRQRLEKGMRK